MAVKWQPGHYLRRSYNSSAVPYETSADINDPSNANWKSFVGDIQTSAQRPGFKGVLAHVFWNHLERVEGTYNWQMMDDCLDICAAEGKYLLVRFMDRNFAGRLNLLPAWLDNYNLPTGGRIEFTTPGGLARAIAVVWETVVMDKYIQLHTAFGSHQHTVTAGQYSGNTYTMDNHPLFVGFVSEETATGLVAGTAGYGYQKYADQFVRYMGEISAGVPQTMVALAINSLGGAVAPNPFFDQLIFSIRTAQTGCFTWPDTFLCQNSGADETANYTACPVQSGFVRPQGHYSKLYGPKGDNSLAIMAQFQAAVAGATADSLIKSAQFFGAHYYLWNDLDSNAGGGITLSELITYLNSISFFTEIGCPTNFGSCDTGGGVLEPNYGTGNGPVSDGFSGIPATPVELRSPEAPNGAKWHSNGLFIGASGARVGTAAANQNAWIEFGSPYQDVQLLWTANVDSNTGALIARANGVMSERYEAHYDAGTATITLYQITVAGGTVSLASVSAAITQTAYHTLRMTVSDDASPVIRVYFDGTEKIAHTDNSANKITAGDYAGFGQRTFNDSGSLFDDFAAQAFVTPKTAAPTVSPLTGTFTNSAIVTASQPNATKIAYTTDGTEPQFDGSGNITNGTLYSTEIQLVTVATHTLTFRAWKTGETQSDVIIAVITIQAAQTPEETAESLPLSVPAPTFTKDMSQHPQVLAAVGNPTSYIIKNAPSGNAIILQSGFLTYKPNLDVLGFAVQTLTVVVEVGTDGPEAPITIAQQFALTAFSRASSEGRLIAERAVAGDRLPR